jgi:lipoprotein NlpD
MMRGTSPQSAWLLPALLLAVAALAGCASRTIAPVIDRLPPGTSAARPPARPAPAQVVAPVPPRTVDSTSETYTVKRGDTLYSIALDHGQDYREVAQWNGIDNPNVIRENQVLRVRPPENAVQVRPLANAGSVESRPIGAGASPARPATGAAPASILRTEPRGQKLPYSEENVALLSRDPKPAAPPKPLEPKPAAELKPPVEGKPEPKPAPVQSAKPEADDDEAVDWGWPTTGRVSAGFSESTNKGLDIAGKTGQPVLASASGTVIYVGSGIRGYGKLLVIRHNKAYSTVYAHNDNILVKEGQRVVKGQRIADMGNSDSDSVKLHFEIRRLGKPVDPAKLLPGR